MKLENFIESKKALFFVLAILILVSLVARYNGSIDTGDYADPAKYFAGKFKADLRNSHSYLYGFVHAPLLFFLDSFILLKVSSIVFLMLIIYSVYRISNRNKKILWLISLSPAVWYMGPWINPIQIASLCLLWAYYFIKDFDENRKVKSLIFSGICVGLGWAFWNTILFFGLFLGIVYLYNKKTYHALYFIIAAFIGLLPQLILDQYLFNFAFFTLIKTTLSNLIATFLGGIYGANSSGVRIIRIFFVFLTVPIYYWQIYTKKKFKENWKTLVFLTLCLLLILTNPQVRYLLAIMPIAVLLLKDLDYKQFKIQVIVSAIITFLFILPYVIQIGYSVTSDLDGRDIVGIFEKRDFVLSKGFTFDIYQEDLSKIGKDFEGGVFLVANKPDSFQKLAHVYFREEIDEFVSVQDYQAYQNNQTVIFSKKLESRPLIPERRQIWIEGGLSINALDKTNYSDINYVISLENELDLKGFEFVRQYRKLSVWKKI